MKQAIIKNINKDIGPNSLEILSYLRPEYDTMEAGSMNELDQDIHEGKTGDDDNCDDEDGLFVVPSDAFSEF